jgi:hypothetical protein
VSTIAEKEAIATIYASIDALLATLDESSPSLKDGRTDVAVTSGPGIVAGERPARRDDQRFLTAAQLDDVRDALEEIVANVQALEERFKKDGRAQRGYFFYGLAASVPIGVLTGWLSTLLF